MTDNEDNNGAITHTHTHTHTHTALKMYMVPILKINSIQPKIICVIISIILSSSAHSGTERLNDLIVSEKSRVKIGHSCSRIYVLCTPIYYSMASNQPASKSFHLLGTLGFRNIS